MSNKKRVFEDIDFNENSGKGDDFDDDDELSSGNELLDSDDEIMEEDLIEQEEQDEGDELKDMDIKDGEEEDNLPKKVWRAGVDKLEEDEVLDYDSTAYDMMHEMTVEWPCLSFHPLHDHLGSGRNKYPHTMYMVAGTQADEPKNNKILIMKLSSLHKTKYDDIDSDDEESDNEDEEDEEDNGDDSDDEAELSYNYISHQGAVNRIRAMEQQSHIIATWSENRQVYIWNIKNHLKSLDDDSKPPKITAPVHLVNHHQDEGYALDWSTKVVGKLASGDCKKLIYVTSATDATWVTDQTPYKGHTGSVEDIQWSPSEDTVLASCSIDQTVKIWDTRLHQKPAASVKAHKADVNVISWSKNVQYLMVSGSDDGSFRVWDLRNFKSDQPVSDFKYHQGPITSIEWNPYEESQIIVSSGDNQVTIWDFSLEEDTEEFKDTSVTNNDDDEDLQYPPQLFFIHQGQTDVKEVHWHPQIPHVAISTAYEGFNIFKTSNSEEQ
ncbi:glutamate-rich WD repeat-containing protein 1 [Tieghemostelium lacteum]|uniref:Glutamate-rich WD repeat-containing protein 1 n=1 Tax=Tieghemostelium lacteum TaxID=361077 RepID=A0A152A3U5_TIELA|nr:glutamate-rich WD repeat-containing protein 1 [Tieghemostelium lacteum]|eukprot:KYR00943.1 glutamate-rich WD repeat-containing protein 1 [Tieghemostelium lacteum]